MFRVIPVLDVRDGRAVHARGGRRADYGPVRSVLAGGDDPVELARAFRDALGRREVYVADLDAIAGRAPDLRLFERLASLGLSLWADAGLRGAIGVRELRDSGVSVLVAGTETLGGAEGLAALVQAASGTTVVVSLDLRDGSPLIAPEARWPNPGLLGLAGTAASLGVGDLIVLDVARVGTGAGAPTAALDTIRTTDPALRVYLGGGVPYAHGLAAARDRGAAGVLMATALHEGRVGVRELAEVEKPRRPRG